MVSIEVEGIPIELTRKPIRNAYLRVGNRDGLVRLNVPATMPEADVVRFVRANREWVLRRIALAASLPKQPESRFISGEMHPVFGRWCRLQVIEGTQRKSVALVDRDTITLRVRSGSDEARRAAVLDAWYRSQLELRIEEIVGRWEPVMGVSVAEWRVKRMRTRWGTCSIRARRIWLSLELAKYPGACLEYVVVHEMNHLIERGHTPSFYALMDRWLPDWRHRRRALRDGLQMTD